MSENQVPFNYNAPKFPIAVHGNASNVNTIYTSPGIVQKCSTLDTPNPVTPVSRRLDSASVNCVTESVGRDWNCTLIPSPGLVHLISGAIAGGVSRTVTAPLDRLKAVLQVTRSSQKVAAVDTLKRLTKDRGFLGLFRGNGANCVKVMPECAIKFLAYDYFKRRLITARHSSEVKHISAKNELTPTFSLEMETETSVQLLLSERLLAGGGAGALSQLIVYPMEVVKTRLATTEHKAYVGIVDCIRKMYTLEGIRAFYRGLCPSVLGIIPYAGLDLACYETLKRNYCNKHPCQKEPPIHIILLCGGFSSAFGQIVAYPLALVRTRLQADGSHGEPRHFTGMCDVFRRTVRVEGFTALYRGLGPNLLKAVPAVSVTWAVYETSKLYIHDWIVK